MSDWVNKHMDNCSVRLKLREHTMDGAAPVTENLKERGNTSLSSHFICDFYKCSRFLFQRARTGPSGQKRLLEGHKQRHWSLKHHLSGCLPAPECQFCLIYHLSLKNIPIMLQSNVTAPAEVYCWNLEKLKNNKASIFLSPRSHLVANPFVHYWLICISICTYQ